MVQANSQALCRGKAWQKCRSRDGEAKFSIPGQFVPMADISRCSQLAKKFAFISLQNPEIQFATRPKSVHYVVCQSFSCASTVMRPD